MMNKEYIDYLNTLHNYDASNQNAFTEENQNNNYFRTTMVDREVGSYINDVLLDNESHILILTGHAGDGKTGLLLQVLNKWNVLKNKKLEAIDTILMPNGKPCTYIKDFSELNDIKRDEIIKDIINKQKTQSAFLVANTGPLISTFKKILNDEDYRLFIDAIDINDGTIKDYSGVKISVVNIATIDNSTFVVPFLNNVLGDVLWNKCGTCKKKAFCPMFFNRNLIKENFGRITQFIEKHYIWQQEYMHKLTIRQIVAHLSYMITGGLKCEHVRQTDNIKFNYLFSNLFFGYVGLQLDKKALRLKAIDDIAKNKYSSKRLYADEILFIKRDLSCFCEDVKLLLEDIGLKTYYSETWQKAVRRAYLMQNIDTDTHNYLTMLQDAFSEWYPRFLNIRKGCPTEKGDKNLLNDALSMIFLGTLQDASDIPVTLNRELGTVQSAQLVIGNLSKMKIKVKSVAVNNYSNNKVYKLVLDVDNGEVIANLGLPLINYFVDVRKGIIVTDIDPLLSHGVDSIKAQIMATVYDNEDTLKIAVMDRNHWNIKEFELIQGKWQIL